MPPGLVHALIANLNTLLYYQLILFGAYQNGCLMALPTVLPKVMAELRELKADIYELGRSLDSGTTARRSHNELSCTKVPLGLTGSSSRPSSSGAQGLAVVKRRSCRSKDNHGARPPSPPPRFSHPTKATHKEVMCLAYNGVSDVPRLVQRVEESARLVSSEKEDALQVCRTEHPLLNV